MHPTSAAAARCRGVRVVKARHRWARGLWWLRAVVAYRGGPAAEGARAGGPALAYVPTLPLLAAWLLKRRKKSVVEIEVEIGSSPDGTGWERRSVRIESAEQSAPTRKSCGSSRR
ncbi:hypothetical protein [Streptomyces sp. NPDC021224]|uniref:hypothetical protein n=1 Tax=unclassified Streptomyces TaxID=2593676 RepID=UPI0037B061CF